MSDPPSELPSELPGLAHPFKDPDVPSAVLFRWFQAEERLYPVAMVMPERYESAVRLVGRLAEQLRASSADLAALVQADQDQEVVAMARRIVEYDPLMATDLDLNLVAGAACSIRYRELAAARSAGDAGQ